MTTTSHDSVVLAHDSFTQLGGAERVFAGIQELYPASAVYTMVADKAVTKQLVGWQIITSPLQAIYNLYPHYQHLFPFIPLTLWFFKIRPARLVISSSSSYIKGLYKPVGGIHINYCHTPTRFLWIDPQHAYQEIVPLLRPLARAYFWWLKKWDLGAAERVDIFIANSKEVQQRIKIIYKRDSEIIYPFVDSKFWYPTRNKGDYFLIAGRLQRAKSLDTVIRSFNETKLPLHVVGSGRFESHLKSIAGPNISFLGRLSDEKLRDEYSGAVGFIYPQLEDFGIMPLEAAACGTATLALSQGGSLETVVPGRTGELFDHVTEQAITEKVKGWDATKYNQGVLIGHAAQFSKEIFQTKIHDIVEKARQS
jgi:glycosyltransferase involved in cell wall biosynthesis